MSSWPAGIMGDVAFATAASNARDSRDAQKPTMAHEPTARAAQAGPSAHIT